jgi:hypothetical protein
MAASSVFDVPRAVEKILRAISDLHGEDLDVLFQLLRERYQFELATDHRSFDRPWRDPRNGFTRLQVRLLDCLDGNGHLPEREVIWRVYRKELATASPAERKQFRARLRSLEKQTRDRLRKLKYDWLISRPKYNHVELRVAAKYL